MTVVDVAIGIVVRESQVLICRRKAGRHLGGYWEFPGGKIANGETAEECVRRELGEEVGLGVKVGRKLDKVEYEYAGRRVRLWPFVCQVINGEAAAKAAEEVRWVEVTELRSYRLPEANGGLVEWLMKNDE
jgi:8-oxo-dGTP diphosphatase